jgi:predicted nucleic acid-binding protein
LLDACVLYPFLVRDVLLQAAAVDFYQAYWSQQILDEALRNLVADGRMDAGKAERLVAAMQRAFPEALVVDHEHLAPAMRNDAKDRHVTAAAVKAGAQVIVTSNLRDFYDLPSGIEAQSPDSFLSSLFDLEPQKMMGVLDTLARRYRKPPRQLLEIVEALHLPELREYVLAWVEERWPYPPMGSSSVEVKAVPDISSERAVTIPLFAPGRGRRPPRRAPR